MATITRENIGLLNDKLSVNVTQEDYLPLFEKSLKSYSKAANIPGFRKGMVPAGLIRKMHGQAIFTEEVVKVVEKELTDYLRQEKLDIFAQPLMMENSAARLDMNKPVEYTFDFEVGLKPSFEITLLQPSTHLTRYKISASDKLIEEEVERLRLKGGKMTEPETIASEDNVVNVVFDECDAEGNLVDGGIQKDNALLVKYFSPAIQQQLTGKQKEDTIVLKLADAFDEERLGWILDDLGLSKDDPEAAQKHFRLKITKIGLVEKRELTADFFKEVYPDKDITTEEAFRNQIREELEKYYQQQSNNRLHNELFEQLVHETPLDLPREFLTRWLQNGGEKPRSPEEAEQEYPHFDHQLRWTLISDKIVRDNKLEVSPEELRAHARKQILGYYGMNEDAAGADWMDSYLDRLMQDEKFLDQTYRELIANHILDWAVAQITVDEQEISLEDFLKLPQNHHHHDHQHDHNHEHDHEHEHA